jgi:probable HAF family extracellular repeat protein
MKTTLSSLISMIGAALLASAPVNAQTYTVDTINPPPGTYACVGQGLNNSGQVVGYTTIQVGTGRKATIVRGPAFIWENGQSASLPPLSGESSAEATGISDAGLAIGGRYLSTEGRATWWENTSSGYQPRDWNDLVPQGSDVTLLRADSISHDGRYVSFQADIGAGELRDIVAEIQLDATGHWPVGITTFWDVTSVWGVTAIHHDGAGLVRAAGLGGPDVDTPGAFRWLKAPDGSTEFTDLHSYTDSSSGAWAVNGLGEVAGDRRNSSGRRAVYWHQDGTMQDIGTLGGTYSTANSINDGGMIVGGAATKGKGKNDGPVRAFLWDGAVMVDLNTRIASSLVLTQARQINNTGQILAWSGSTPVLLTPQ